MAIIMGGRRFFGNDLSGYRRVTQRGPLAGFGALPSARDLEAKIKAVKDAPWLAMSTLDEIEGMFDGVVSPAIVAAEVTSGVAAGRSPGDIAQRLLALAAGGASGGSPSAPRGRSRTLDQLATGDVAANDTVAASGFGLLKVTSVGAQGITLEAQINTPREVYESAEKRVSSSGEVFYVEIQYILGASGLRTGSSPPSWAHRVAASTKTFYLSKQGVDWNGFVRKPAVVRLVQRGQRDWIDIIKPFGGERPGTLLRTDQQGSSMPEGSTEERVYLAAERAESAAASEAARAGKNASAIQATARQALAMAIVSGMGVSSYAALPAGFKNMISESDALAAIVAIAAGVPPPAPAPGPTPPRPPPAPPAPGPRWGLIAGVAGGALALVGLIAVFARGRRRPAAA